MNHRSFQRDEFRIESTHAIFYLVELPVKSLIIKSFLYVSLNVLSVYKSYLPLVYLQGLGTDTIK